MTSEHYANVADFLAARLLMEQECGPGFVDRFLSKEGLSVEMFDSQSDFIPISKMCLLYERAAREIGDPLFGVHAGKHWRCQHMGPVGEYITSADTLHAGLVRAIAVANLYEGGTDAGLVWQEDAVELRYRRLHHHSLGIIHYQDFNVSALIEIIRHYCGKSWQPIRIATDVGKEYANLKEAEYGVPMEFDHVLIKIVIPMDDLSTPNPCRLLRPP